MPIYLRVPASIHNSAISRVFHSFSLFGKICASQELKCKTKTHTHVHTPSQQAYTNRDLYAHTYAGKWSNSDKWVKHGLVWLTFRTIISSSGIRMCVRMCKSGMCVCELICLWVRIISQLGGTMCYKAVCPLFSCVCVCVRVCTCECVRE